ncbi:MAG TPA: cyclic nucleotide-binding domain-containing protein [Candidatus Deferrimicrobiaceae bacterium]
MEELGFSVKFLKTYGDKEVIFEEESVGKHMYVINSGRVNILKKIDGQDVHVGSLGPGEIFGEMALVDNLPRSASAVAAADGTSVVEIDHSQFVYLVGQQPAFALIILKALSLRLRGRMGHDGAPAGPEKGAAQ